MALTKDDIVHSIHTQLDIRGNRSVELVESVLEKEVGTSINI